MYHSPDKRPLQGSIKHYEDMIHKDLEERGLVHKNTDFFTKMAHRSFSHDFREGPFLAKIFKNNFKFYSSNEGVQTET